MPRGCGLLRSGLASTTTTTTTTYLHIQYTCIYHQKHLQQQQQLSRTVFEKASSTTTATIHIPERDSTTIITKGSSYQRKGEDFNVTWLLFTMTRLYFFK